MPLSFEHIFVVALMIAFLLKRFFAGKVDFVDRFGHTLNLLFFIAIAIFLGYQFWLDELYVGIFAIFLGCLAFGKYYYDVSTDG